MPRAPFADFLHYLYRLYPDHDGRGDGELLQRFLAQKDDTAFAAIISRHGRLVQGVCRRILGDFHSAEDCFQATFIVLARRAGSIRMRHSLATWLYAVAQRVALRARARAALRREREKEAMAMPRGDEIDEATWQELRPILDEEIGRLAEKYRAPLLLCHFEGKSRKRIAQELGWAEGTVARRLTRGRELLKTKLARRGIALSIAALAVVLTDKCAGAPVAVALTTSTTKAALSFLSGQTAAAGCLSGQALALADQVISAVAAKAKLVALLAIGLVISTTGYASYAAGKTNETSVPRAEKSVPVVPATGAAATGVNRNWLDLYRYIDSAIPRPNGDEPLPSVFDRF